MNLFLTRLADACCNAIFPNRCIGCGVFFHSGAWARAIHARAPVPVLPDSFAQVMSPFLCPACISGFSTISEPFCSICGRGYLSANDHNHPCGECLTHARHYRKARALGSYEDVLSKIVQAYKYKGRIELAEPLGVLLFQLFLEQYPDRAIDLIIPVPLHIRRLRQRGFNQAYLMIRKWKRLALTLKLKFSWEIDPFILERQKWTVPQVHQDRNERRQNVKNAFAVSRPDQVAGRQILLIDDVYTTGATVDECAKALLKAGAGFVDVLTLARATLN